MFELILIAQFYPPVDLNYAETNLYCYYDRSDGLTLDLTEICGPISAEEAEETGDSESSNEGGSVSIDIFSNGDAVCNDFDTQAQAIAALPTNPQLDGDGDGIPCESLPR
ncbi:MAG: excalibur calcium-binding domain-containing protein [Cyanobacteria bacterium J06626_18]